MLSYNCFLFHTVPLFKINIPLLFALCNPQTGVCVFVGNVESYETCFIWMCLIAHVWEVHGSMRAK